ncbi:uncharacterized protein N0V89_008907 [Didymosphaeria variabile]|uniref:Uncharacterized protein n=1 Tax=Didymosphaeria variabile TaxID=1932322 RepID=A0A9W9C8Z7_9PLEO|nr:uncharacterized protein N0V89_008907 [Didymosphaeria variabile]KAJ4350286.1 hypothetical protein N0V89_008907 [Didymosphaeria variabile]
MVLKPDSSIDSIAVVDGTTISRASEGSPTIYKYSPSDWEQSAGTDNSFTPKPHPLTTSVLFTFHITTMKAFTAALVLAAAVASAAPLADPIAEPTLNTRVGAFSTEACYGDWCEKKREPAAEATLNIRVGAFSTEACYGDWCEKKREVAERSAKEARKADAKTINTRINGSQNYTGGGKKRDAKTINTRINGSQNYTGGGKKREAEAEAQAQAEK